MIIELSHHQFFSEWTIMLPANLTPAVLQPCKASNPTYNKQTESLILETWMTDILNIPQKTAVRYFTNLFSLRGLLAWYQCVWVPAKIPFQSGFEDSVSVHHAVVWQVSVTLLGCCIQRSYCGTDHYPSWLHTLLKKQLQQIIFYI